MQPIIGAVLDNLSWRPIHARIVLALGIGWMLDAFEVTIVGNVLGVLQKLWQVTAGQASLLVSVWLIGVMVGAVWFGYLSDRFGRRKLFILTLLLYSTFTVASALSPGYYAFLCFRFLTAVGVGAEYSAINAAISELIPARYRGRASAIVMNFWPFGSILAGFVTLYFINSLPPSIGWRVAFALGAVIALFTIWIRRTLPESPRWRASRKHNSEAIGINGDAQMPSPNGTCLTDVSEEKNLGFFCQLRRLIRYYPGRLALGCALDFSEAAGYYSLFTLLPLVVLPHLHIPDTSVPLFFIIGNVGAVIGGLMAAFGLDRLGRKATVAGFYSLAALSMLYMGAATVLEDSRSVLIAFTVANLCATGSWVAAYPTFSEIFPTSLRATGIGFSVSFGRIGAIIAPPLVIFLAEYFSFGVAFGAMAAFWLLGVIAMIPWSIWGPEGKGKPLESLAAG